MLSIIKNGLGNLKNSRMYIAPYIPEQKLNGVLNTYVMNTQREDVLLVYDKTILGGLTGSADGFTFTCKGIFEAGTGLTGTINSQIDIEYKDVRTVSYEEDEYSLFITKHASVIINGKSFCWIEHDNNKNKNEMIKRFKSIILELKKV